MPPFLSNLFRGSGLILRHKVYETIASEIASMLTALLQFAETGREQSRSEPSPAGCHDMVVRFALRKSTGVRAHQISPQNPRVLPYRFLQRNPMRSKHLWPERLTTSRSDYHVMASGPSPLTLEHLSVSHQGVGGVGEVNLRLLAFDCGQVLVPDVFGRRGINGILRHVGGVIAHALEAARDKNQIQIAAQLRGIFRHSFDEAATGG